MGKSKFIDVSVSKAGDNAPEAYVQQYWACVKELCKVTGDLARARGLRSSIDTKREPVARYRDILERDYDGSYDRLAEKIGELESSAEEAVETFNRLCGVHEVSLVSKKEETIERLVASPERRRLYRRFADKHMKMEEILPLSVLEEEFQEWEITRFSK